MRRPYSWDRGLGGACLATVGQVLLTGCGNVQTECELNLPSDAQARPEAAEAEADSGGLIQVNGTFTNSACANVAPISVGPNNGGSVSLSAMVFALPYLEGGNLIFHWSAPSGSFSNPDALDTTFTCAAPGLVTVTFTVSDSSASCSPQEASAKIRCD